MRNSIIIIENIFYTFENMLLSRKYDYYTFENMLLSRLKYLLNINECL
jgi:hypothetical protein